VAFSNALMKSTPISWHLAVQEDQVDRMFANQFIGFQCIGTAGDEVKLRHLLIY
jgi:hypothetical protein